MGEQGGREVERGEIDTVDRRLERGKLAEREKRGAGEGVRSYIHSIQAWRSNKPLQCVYACVCVCVTHPAYGRLVKGRRGPGMTCCPPETHKWISSL